MEEQDRVEPDYLKGFNEGYLLAQHRPQLAQQLASIDSNSLRLNGFKDGHRQHQLEATKTRLPSWMKDDRFGKPKDTPERDKEKDRDIEPEK